MLKLKTLNASASIAAILSAGAVQADVTAADVWANWQEVLSIYGESGVTIGAEETTSDSVTVSGLSMEMSDDEFAMSADLGTLVFQEQGDGTVAITMAENYPMTMKGEDGTVIGMSIRQSGMALVASGTADDIIYDMSADTYVFQIDDVTSPEGPVKADVRFAMNDVSGTYNVNVGDLRNLAYTVSTGSVDILADVADPESNGAFLLSGKINGLAVNADMALPLDTSDPEAMFNNGLSFDAQYSYDDSGYLFEFDDPEGGSNGTGTISTGPAQIAGNMDMAMMGYDTLINDFAATVTSSDMPFPVSFAMGQLGTGFTMPLQKTDTPEDFAISLNLSEVSVNEEIWMMVDPGNALSHEPATMKLDLTGTAKLFFDILDPDQADAMAMAAQPGELHSLNLNDLTLAIAGALITGEGAFTFDNTDMETFDGVPRPEGSATVNIKGANALIDKLVGMGLLPEDQAMMGRMMMGMFARTVGDDELTSTIEVNAEGHVLANGQRIQ